MYFCSCSEENSGCSAASCERCTLTMCEATEKSERASGESTITWTRSKRDRMAGGRATLYWRGRKGTRVGGRRDAGGMETDREHSDWCVVCDETFRMCMLSQS